MEVNEKETLKDWIKHWDIENIVSNLVSAGMEYMVYKISTEDLREYKAIATKELTKRIKKEAYGSK